MPRCGSGVSAGANTPRVTLQHSSFIEMMKMLTLGNSSGASNGYSDGEHHRNEPLLGS